MLQPCQKMTSSRAVLWKHFLFRSKKTDMGLGGGGRSYQKELCGWRNKILLLLLINWNWIAGFLFEYLFFQRSYIWTDSGWTWSKPRCTDSCWTLLNCSCWTGSKPCCTDCCWTVLVELFLLLWFLLHWFLLNWIKTLLYWFLLNLVALFLLLWFLLHCSC